MRILRRVNVGIRLGGAFGVLVVLMLLGVAMSLAATNSIKQAQDEIVEHADLLLAVEEARYEAANLNGWQNAYVIQAYQGDQTALEDTSANRAAYLQSAQDLQGRLDSIPPDLLAADQQAELQAMQESFDEFAALDTRIVELLRTGRAADAEQAVQVALSDAIEVFTGLSDAGGRLAQSVANDARQINEAADATADRMRTLTIVVGVLSVLVAVILAYAITRSITDPLWSVVRVLRKVARGDLSPRANDHARDEVGKMGVALDETLDTVAGTIDAISQGSTTLSASSEEVAGGQPGHGVDRRGDRPSGGVGVGRRRTGLPEPAVRVGRGRGDGGQHPRDREQHQQRGRSGRTGGDRGPQYPGHGLAELGASSARSAR